MMILRVSKGAFFEGRDNNADQRKLGVNIEQADSGRDGLEYLRVYDYDLLLVDMSLPDISAYEFIRLVRTAGHLTPIVVLADRATVEQKIKALDQGADDVVTMPCDTQELMARMRTVIRRSQGHAASTLRIGPVELRLDRREVTANGQKLSLTRREFSTLELLFLRQGAILTKATFLNHLYCGSEEPEVKSVDVTICRVRKKLAAAGVPNLIDTVWGCGYILRAPDTAPTDVAPLTVPAMDMEDATMAGAVDLAAWRSGRGRMDRAVASAS